jgi:hypothetical protein
MPNNQNTISYAQIAQQQNFCRSDIATTKRAFQDLIGQTKKLEGEILHLAATDTICPKERFQDAWDKREQLNNLNQQLTSIQQQMNNYMPPASTARLTEKERREIKALYQSGLYNQQQLADQYGVTQPTISDIVNV